MEEKYTLNTDALSGIDGTYDTPNPTLKGINAEADKVEKELLGRCDILDGSAVAARLDRLDALLAWTGQMHSTTKAMREEAKAVLYRDNAEAFAKMKATDLTRLTGLALRQFAVTEERMSILYRTIEQSCKTLITQLSYLKKQMEL